jgi:UDP-glucose 4-epimerase
MSGRETVVVTGGCGFIGSHLVRSLFESGRRVRVLDDLSNGDPARLPAGVELREGDVADATFVRGAVADAVAVVHLAAVASVNRCNERWQASHLTNSAGSVVVMEALRDLAPEASFVYASSAAVYGNPTGDEDGLGRVRETAPTLPLSPYGVDKLACEMHARVGGSLFGLRSFGLRFFNVFGVGQAYDSPYSGVITQFVANAVAGRPLTIYGDGRQTRDFVHVRDVVRAIELAESLASAAAPVVNVCTGQPTSIGELAGAIVRLAGRDVPIALSDARPGDIRHSVGDPTMAFEKLEWRPSVSLEQGLAELVSSREAGAQR